MTELRPTKARLALLQAVADGAVTEHYGIFPSSVYAEWDHGADPGHVGRRYQTVTARIDALCIAGWIRVGEPGTAHYKASRPYELTPAGGEILRQNGGTP